MSNSILPRGNISKWRYQLRLAKKMWWLYALLIPAVLVIYVFHYRPMYGITLAFKNYRILKGIKGSPWAGLKYFDQLFGAFSFWEVIRNTVVISLEHLIFGFPMPIILALFLNEMRNQKLKKVFQTISYLPHFLSWVILGGIVRNLVSPQYGIINYLITMLGGKPIYFLTSAKWFRPILIVSSIWAGVGWGSIIYLAGISGIDPQLYEAAVLDGAGKLKCIWHVTLPGIRALITIQLVMSMSNILNAGFDQVFNLYSPAVYSIGDILDTYTYRQGVISGNYSYSTAAGLFKNVVGFIMVTIANFVASKVNEGEGRIW